MGFAACATQGHAPELSLQELLWLPAGTNQVTALTSKPASCLVAAETPDIAAEVRLGELVFNSPALLGGQAEKKGLSCGSCHQNGRGNQNFQFEAVSGAPGTADVTSGLFSAVRADNMFNPLPIPDLAAPDGQDQVDRRDRVALRKFVRGQIEDEFSGDPAPEPVMAVLLTYLSHIDGEGSGCDLTARTQRNWQDDWQDAALAADEARKAEGPAPKAFYTRTARIALRRLHERYSAPEQVDIRYDLVKLSRALADGLAWPRDSGKLRARLEQEAGNSLYAPENLAAALRANEH